MTNETTKPGWDEYQDISNTLTQLLNKGYTKPMIKTVLEQKRDCKTCKHSDNGNCAGTEECHECMWDSKYEQQPSEDCISKAAALDTLKTSFLGMSFERYKKAKRMFEQLPPVTPQRPEGRWIATENEEMNIDGYYCSCCDLPMETEERTDYCPNCGAKMKAERSGRE